MKVNWPCQFIASTVMPDKRSRTITFIFDGEFQAESKGLAEFFRRSKKPYLWYGVGFTIYTPLGQCIHGVIER
jgi:hypothetical protein